MSIEDIYFELKNLPLIGEITIDEGQLKWKYDSFMIYSDDDVETHLEEVYSEDSELISEMLVDFGTEYSLTVPEVEDTWVYFYIER